MNEITLDMYKGTDIEKGFKVGNLTQKQVQVQRGGKTFMMTVWVNPNANLESHSLREFKNKLSGMSEEDLGKTLKKLDSKKLGGSTFSKLNEIIFKEIQNRKKNKK